ncbi:translation initiation factor IF-2 [Triticum aestivum]|uniref:translation initiation factor IF-2 n=1 Tax=Triticum aestivum TaxID=4565 RepID=UPI001D00C010|nr:translation initiation factor IF-2-like [Triticum aestivum]
MASTTRLTSTTPTSRLDKKPNQNQIKNPSNSDGNEAPLDPKHRTSSVTASRGKTAPPPKARSALTATRNAAAGGPAGEAAPHPGTAAAAPRDRAQPPPPPPVAGRREEPCPAMATPPAASSSPSPSLPLPREGREWKGSGGKGRQHPDPQPHRRAAVPRYHPWRSDPAAAMDRDARNPSYPWRSDASTSKERTRAGCRPSPATSDHGCSDLDQLLLLLLQVDEDEPSHMAATAAYSLLLPPGLVCGYLVVTSWDIEAATGMCYAILRDEKKMVQRGGRIAVQTDWLEFSRRIQISNPP